MLALRRLILSVIATALCLATAEAQLRFRIDPGRVIREIERQLTEPEPDHGHDPPDHDHDPPHHTHPPHHNYPPHHNHPAPAHSTHLLPHSGQYGQGYYYIVHGHYYYVPYHGRGRYGQPILVQFGSFAHVDDLASRFEFLMNEFCLDLHYNYQHNPHFKETYREAYGLLQTAKYIHAAEHQQNRQAIAEQLGGADALFHHLEDDVRGWSRHHRRQIGQRGIVSKMELIGSTIHHLMNVVGVHTAPLETAPPPGGVEQAPPPASF